MYSRIRYMKSLSGRCTNYLHHPRSHNNSAPLPAIDKRAAFPSSSHARAMASESPATVTDRPTTNITLWQKIDFLPAIIQIIMGTAGTAFFAPFRGQHAPKTFKRHVILSLMRRAVGRFSPAQLQWVAGTTGAAYGKWTKAQGIQPRSVALPRAQTAAFWLGDPSSDIITLYFHGGGWAVPAGDGQFKFLSEINATAAASGKSLAFLILQYDLAPGKQYPHQLKQCVELLRYAIEDKNKSPKELMLGGDSAGGNLVFSVLLHLLYPHPEIEPLRLSHPLKAAFASSPWVDFDMTSERFNAGDEFDAAPVSTLRIWASNYIGASKSDEWLEPAKAKAKYWKGLGNVVDEVLITIAKEEVMADDVREMVANIEGEYKKLTLFAAAEDFHAEPVLGSNAGFEMGEAAKVIKSWVADKC